MAKKISEEIIVWGSEIDAPVDEIKSTIKEFCFKHNYYGLVKKLYIQREGNKDIWLGRTIEIAGYEEEERFLGFIDINPTSYFSVGPVEVNIVCIWPPIYKFLEDLSFELIEKFLFPKAVDEMTEISKDLMNTKKKKDSGHYKYPPEIRQEIASEYREDRKKGKIKNKVTWAKIKHDICVKTLNSYLEEFPESET